MPSSVRRTLRLQDYLPYRLSVAANAVSRLIARAYEARFGLKIAQWRLIAVLADEGPLTQQSLCGRTLMDKVRVMRAAQGLVRRGLVRRLPNHSARSECDQPHRGEVAAIASCISSEDRTADHGRVRAEVKVGPRGADAVVAQHGPPPGH